MKHEARYLSASAVAARYSVARNTIWRWRESGELPEPVKLSTGCTRWAVADLEAWEQSRKKSDQRAA